LKEVVAELMLENRLLKKSTIGAGEDGAAGYADEVMRHTSEASQALLRARTFAEMLEVQAKLLRDNMQSFVDQSARIAEAAGRMATRSFDVVKEASRRPNSR